MTAECSYCHAAKDDLMICAGCKRAAYCCKEHQKAHWKHHKTQCRVGSNGQAPGQHASAKAREHSEMMDSLSAQLAELLETKDEFLSNGLINQAKEIDALIAKVRKGIKQVERNMPPQAKGAPPADITTAASPLPAAESRADTTTTPAPPAAAVVEREEPAGCSGADMVVETDLLGVKRGLRIVLGLPEGVTSARDLDITVSDDSSQMAVQFGDAAAQRIEIPAEFTPLVDCDNIKAKLSKKAKTLTISLPFRAAVPECVGLVKGVDYAERIEKICGDLRERHHSVIDGFLDTDACGSLLGLLQSYESDGKMEKGEIRGGLKEAMRSDLAMYVGSDSAPDGLSQFFRSMDNLVYELSSRIAELEGLKLFRSKAMLTCYPGAGTRYTKHVDNMGSNGRKLTCVLYLNTDWQPSHGGVLRLYRPNQDPGHIDVAPVSNRLILFFSDARNPHEVMPAHQSRYAASIWYMCSEEAFQQDDE